MGQLKLFLSVCVLISHTSTYLGNIGYSCVFGFFMISGYGITYSLEKRYNNLSEYYSKRCRKIYIPYFLCTGITVALYFLFHLRCPSGFPYVSPELSFKGVLLEFIYNIGMNDNFWHLLNGFPKFVPQAWTDPIMIVFYIIAPALVAIHQKSKIGYWLIGTILISIPCVSIIKGHDFSMYRYRSVFCVLIYFFGGGVIYYTKSKWRISMPKIGLVLFSLIYLFFFYQRKFVLPLELQIMVSLFIMIPMIICAIQIPNNAREKYYSEISAYIYLTHFIGIAGYELISSMFYDVQNYQCNHMWLKSLIVLCISVLLSCLLQKINFSPSIVDKTD